ncbi:hypothetical protein [Priestia megaterium]
MERAIHAHLLWKYYGISPVDVDKFDDKDIRGLIRYAINTLEAEAKR